MATLSDLLRRKRQFEATGRRITSQETAGIVSGSLRSQNELALRHRGFSLQERQIANQQAQFSQSFGEQQRAARRSEALQEEAIKDQETAGFLQTGVTIGALALGTEGGRNLLGLNETAPTTTPTTTPTQGTTPTAGTGTAGGAGTAAAGGAASQLGGASGTGLTQQQLLQSGSLEAGGGASAGVSGGGAAAGLSNASTLSTTLRGAGGGAGAGALAGGVSQAVNPAGGEGHMGGERATGFVSGAVGGAAGGFYVGGPVGLVVGAVVGGFSGAGLSGVDAAERTFEKDFVRRSTQQSTKSVLDPVGFTKELVESDRSGLAKVVDPLDVSGTVVCTELNRQGYMSDELKDFSHRYGSEISPEIYEGYLVVAKPIVELMQKSKWFTRLVAKFALPWAFNMANKYKPKQYPKTLIGALVMILGKPLCRITRLFVERRRSCIKSVLNA